MDESRAEGWLCAAGAGKGGAGDEGMEAADCRWASTGASRLGASGREARSPPGTSLSGSVATGRREAASVEADVGAVERGVAGPGAALSLASQPERTGCGAVGAIEGDATTTGACFAG
jgi:hypothetical protein